jgi:hypothetical protein
MKGDYAPGAKLEPVRIEIEVDPQTFRLSHVGIGYHVRLPSGRMHEGGYTWHSPKGDYAQGPAEHIADLQRVVDALLGDAASYEGVELGPGRVQGQAPELAVGPGVEQEEEGQDTHPHGQPEGEVLGSSEDHPATLAGGDLAV